MLIPTLIFGMPINVLKMKNVSIFILKIQISSFYRAICFLCGMATTGCKLGCLTSNVCIMRIMNGTIQLIPLCSTPHIVLWSSCEAKHKKYYKGEGGGFPQVQVVVSLVSPCLPMVHPCTKGVPTMH